VLRRKAEGLARDSVGDRTARAKCVRIGGAFAQHLPAAAATMRAAVNLDGSHPAHEGLGALHGHGVCSGHVQQLACHRQLPGLDRRGEQAVVADALEAHRQHVLQQPPHELHAGIPHQNKQGQPRAAGGARRGRFLWRP
jgi:hypothetical protein